MASIFTARRVALPLTVLMIAAMLAWWSNHRHAQAEAQIHSYLLRLCEDVQGGRELRGTLQQHDSFSERQLIEQLRRVCSTAADASNPLEIAVSQGDVEHAGAENATHTALFARNGREELGLRLHFDHGSATTQILGYWLPSHAP